MMFVPYYMHPLFKLEDRERYQNRWRDPGTGEENSTHQKVLEFIKQGGGKYFLDLAFSRRELPILEDDRDLKGINLSSIEQDFGGDRDNFKGINFRYAEFWNCHFKNAAFYSCSLEFVEFFNCTFENCGFAFVGFLGAKMEKCVFRQCDFAEHCSFESTTVVNSMFDGCFFGRQTPFQECFFDDLTSIKDMKMHSYHLTQVDTSPAALAGYFSSFQAAYEASGADELASKYYWEGRKAYTRHNTRGWQKGLAFTVEVLTGYGVKPQRPLVVMLLLYVAATALFAAAMPLKESIVFTAGALFTFGASSEHLNTFGYGGRLAYVALSFSGVSLVSLFVTSLANLWFRSKIPKQTIRP